MELYFDATFSTDGDFSFYVEKLKSMFDIDCEMYKKAKINYIYMDNKDERIYIRLFAEGDADACRWAMRDLLEGLMCSIKTFKHYVVKEIYELLDYFHEDLWSNLNQTKHRGLYGNYDNTWLSLTMKE